MNVRRAVVDGIKQHLLDELYNRSIVDFECRCVVGLFLILVVGKLEIDVLVGQVSEGVLGRFREFGNQRGKQALINDHRVDGHPGLEANLVECAKICWVGDGDR